jgi:hypothetical protein
VVFRNSANTKKALPRTGELKQGILPTMGLNARDSYLDMDPRDAISIRNLISGTLGMRVRFGYQEWAANLPGNLPVPTIMSYYPPSAQQSGAAALLYPTGKKEAGQEKPLRVAVEDVNLNGQLFACTNSNIYDISLGGEGPWVAESGVGTITSDYWIWRNFQNAGGAFLVATNYNGAYVVYGGAGFSSGFDTGFATEGSGFTRVSQGVQPSQIQGVNPNLFAYVAVWKQRLWFAEKNSSRAWYLPPAQLTGEAHQFDFGPQFRHGGHLVALANWTIDGGEGIDDYLVAVSSEGDVVIYKGYDPDAAGENPEAFQLHGVWYVGPLPHGRRQVDPYGGDVYILSVMGVRQVSKLVIPGNTENEGLDNISTKIDPELTAISNLFPEATNYYIKGLPNQNAIAIGTPEVLAGEGAVQYYYSIPNRAWSPLYALPVEVWANHDHLTFAGTNRVGLQLGGVVYLMFENQLDDVKLNPLLPNAEGTYILSRMVPAYSTFGTPGLWKNFPMVRPTLLANDISSFAISVLLDYELPDQAPEFISGGVPVQSLWDVDDWDRAVWAGATNIIKEWIATDGGGYAATAQFDYFTLGGTRFITYEHWITQGGPL